MTKGRIRHSPISVSPGASLALAALVAGIALAWLNRAALSPAALEAALSHSALAPLLYLAVHIAASLLFIPRALVAAAAGLMFGLWWGLLWATVGSMLGSAAGFSLPATSIAACSSSRRCRAWQLFSARRARRLAGGGADPACCRS